MAENILSDSQVKFLKMFGGEPKFAPSFYLTGGTPLAAFYLHHRYSEDLDFFSEKEIDPLPINSFLKKHEKDLGVVRLDYEQSFNRNLFFIHLRDEVLKIEFTFFPFPRIATGAENYGVATDSLLDIAVNKLFTVYQRTKARDYVDLFFACSDEKYAISDLIQKAKSKFDWHIDPLQLGTQFMRASEVEDWPRMIRPLDRRAFSDFFRNEAKKLGHQVLE